MIILLMRASMQGAVISASGKTPTQRLAMLIRKIAMEDAGVGVENQRQKIAISLPHWQKMELFKGVPGEGSFLIFEKRGAVEKIDPEDKTQPVLPVRAKAGPVDGSAQQDFLAVDSSVVRLENCM